MWVWNRSWGDERYYLKIPNELQVIDKLGENNVEYFKLDLTDYVLKEAETHFTCTDDPEYDELIIIDAIVVMSIGLIVYVYALTVMMIIIYVVIIVMIHDIFNIYSI